MTVEAYHHKQTTKPEASQVKASPLNTEDINIAKQLHLISVYKHRITAAAIEINDGCYRIGPRHHAE